MIVDTLIITFSPLLSLEEVPLFRGAVLKALSEDTDVLFHNHIDDNFRYDYPLVQYKSVGTKATIMCIGAGVDLLSKLMPICNSKLFVGRRHITLKVEKITPRQTEIELSGPQHYRIEHWLPLNEENDTRFMGLKSDSERNELLERILVGNILSMAKGLNIRFDDQVDCKIQRLDRYHLVKVKETFMKSFDVDFICNVNLPDLIGIGKHASIGCGLVRQTDRPQTLFLLGGHDLEMNTIKQMLGHRADCKITDKDLAWNNALLSAYSKELEESSKFDRIYGIELKTDIPVPDNYFCIDHHNNLENMPSSLEQTAMIVGVHLNRHQQLVAANDRGYIPGMQALSASEKEIAEIRRQDREAQGISNADELLAEVSITQHLIHYPNLSVVKSLTSHFSTICDRLYPYKRLLIYTDDEWVFYGEGKNELSLQFADEIQQGRVYHGGGDNGFIGCAEHSFDKASIEKVVKQIINKYENQ